MCSLGLILPLKRAEKVILGSRTSRPVCLRAGEGSWGIACRVQEGLAVSETAAEGTAVQGRVAVGAQVAVRSSCRRAQAGRVLGGLDEGAAASQVQAVTGLAFL